MRDEPDLGQAYCQRFLSVVRFRDGLVHAAATVSTTPGTVPPSEEAVATMETLSGLNPGWALDENAGVLPPCRF
jgi:hypothetical protein